MDKKKILTISDMPLIPSGVGTQANYLITGLLKTGKYRVVSMGGAIKHPDYRPIKTEQWGDDWILHPIDGYGDKDVLRGFLARERPDALIFVTDPRFYVWLWEMEDEVRSICPMVYWHVWDNDPTPRFNKVFYDSTDHVAALSLKTYGLLQDMGSKNISYIPHGLPTDLFRPMPDEEVAAFKQQNYGPHRDRRFIVFWNNRNARRKSTGDVVECFAKFSEKVGRENVALMMHTSVQDPEGQDIRALAERFGVSDLLIISENRISPEVLNMYYNVADCTINVASNEGFGLATLESLYAGTPIVVHMTGGLQFQVGPWWQDGSGASDVDLSDQEAMFARAKKLYANGKCDWWGSPVFPAARRCTGSQPIPYIYDDVPNHKDVVDGLVRLYRMKRDERRALGRRASEWASKTFSLPKMVSSFDGVISSEIERHAASGGRCERTATL